MLTEQRLYFKFSLFNPTAHLSLAHSSVLTTLVLSRLVFVKELIYNVRLKLPNDDSGFPFTLRARRPV